MKHLYALYYVIFLSALVSGLCFGTHPVKAEEAPILASLVTIDKKQVNITQVFETIREQSGVNVKIQGNKPSAKRDVILPEMPMNQAIKKVLKLYGIESHAAVYNFDTKDVLLVILQASAMPDTLPAGTGAEKGEIKFMTAAEFAALTPGKTDDSKHMTPEEFKKLPRGKPANSKYMTPREYAELPPGIEDNAKGMTPEDFAKLPPGKSDDSKYMTPEEFAELPPGKTAK